MLYALRSTSCRCVALVAFFTLLSASTISAQSRVPRILVGVETDDYPAVGIVGSLNLGGFCTGTLISPTHVLTAAHCAEVIEGPSDGTFELGDQVYRTADVLIHPDYNPFTFANDVAILELDEPVLDVEPSQIFRDAPLVGDLLFIVGFGGTGSGAEGSDGTFGVKRVGVTTIDEVTDDLVSWFFDDESESNTAAGDSGGPGYIDIEGDLFVACVVSGGTEPDSILGDFAFNTRVDAFADWIDLTVAGTPGPADDSPQNPQDTPSDSGDDDSYWSKPFPLLQFLIDILTQLLDFLIDGVNGQGVGPAPETPTETPAGPTQETPSETPGDPGQQSPGGQTPPATTDEDPSGETPGETSPENPADCPAPSDPGTTDPGTTTPITEVPIDGTLPDETLPTETLPGGTLPGGTLPGGITLPGGGGTLPDGTIPEDVDLGAAFDDLTSGSVLAAWYRSIRLLQGGLNASTPSALLGSASDD